MERTELYLKTIFCCMACDGEIAKEEVEMIKSLSSKYEMFSTVGIESYLNNWIALINENGVSFLKGYLNELSEADLSSSEQIRVIDFAIMTIEADKCIEYSEMKRISALSILKLNFSKKYVIVCLLVMKKYWSNIQTKRIICSRILML